MATPLGPRLLGVPEATIQQHRLSELVGGMAAHNQQQAAMQCMLSGLSTLHDLAKAKAVSPTLRNLFARYADCLTAQIMQSVACNAAHSIEQRAARWLLTAVELTGSEEIALTQEQMASMLGVGRSYLTKVLRELKRRDLLETRRGRLIARSIPGLKLMACECNGAIAEHFNTVLAGVYPEIALSA